MTGSSLFDYVHQQDHSELAEILGITTSHPGASSSHMAHSPLPPASVASNASSESESTPFTNPGSLMTVNGPNDTFERQFCIRMKSTLTKRGCQHFKSSGYRVVHVISHLRLESAQQRSECPVSTAQPYHLPLELTTSLMLHVEFPLPATHHSLPTAQ